MKTENKSINIIDRFPSLSLALLRLLEGKEKNWGCFQIIKEDSFYRLDIPYLPIMRFYQNQEKNIYKIYWHERNKYEDWQDLNYQEYQSKTYSTSTKKYLEVFIRKKQRKIYVFEKKTRVEKIQRLYEVVCYYNPESGVQIVNKILANLIKDQMKEHLRSHPTPGEAEPLVVITEENKSF
jgi:hypothetical protein